MKSFAALVMAAAVLASPVQTVQKRLPTTLTENEFTSGGCRDVVFLWARGSTESGNMGSIIGIPLSDGLKGSLGDSTVATEGVDYAALLSTNFLPGGADLAGIAEMVDLFNQVATQCPGSKIVAGGYSQGSALTHRAVEQLSDSVIAQIAGITLFGDTQFLQSGGRIANFPESKTKIFCAFGDLVCAGTLTITAAHLTYGANADEATSFLVNAINSA